MGKVSCYWSKLYLAVKDEHHWETFASSASVLICRNKLYHLCTQAPSAVGLMSAMLCTDMPVCYQMDEESRDEKHKSPWCYPTSFSLISQISLKAHIFVI